MDFKPTDKTPQPRLISHLDNFHVLCAYLHVENMLEVPMWKGNPRDKELLYLRDLLKKVVADKDKENDVRNVLQKYNLSFRVTVNAEENGAKRKN
jgi:hypothetical protein